MELDKLKTTKKSKLFESESIRRASIRKLCKITNFKEIKASRFINEYSQESDYIF